MKRIVLLCALLATPAFAVAPGTADGTMTVNGKSVKLKYAMARTQKNPFHADKRDIVVLLSDKPIPAEKFKDEFGMMDVSGTFTGVQVEIDPDKEINSGMIYSPELKKYNGSFSSTGMHNLEATKFEPSEVAGKLYMKKQDEFFGNTYQYSATFDATVSAPVKKTAAALPGKPLPAGGGEPGKVYLAYAKVLAAQNAKEMRKMVCADTAKEMDTPDFKKMLSIVAEMHATDIKITGGAVDGNNATLLATGKEGGQLSNGTITMASEGGAWKVCREQWKSGD